MTVYGGSEDAVDHGEVDYNAARRVALARPQMSVEQSVAASRVGVHHKFGPKTNKQIMTKMGSEALPLAPGRKKARLRAAKRTLFSHRGTLSSVDELIDQAQSPGDF